MIEDELKSFHSGDTGIFSITVSANKAIIIFKL